MIVYHNQPLKYSLTTVFEAVVMVGVVSVKDRVLLGTASHSVQEQNK